MAKVTQFEELMCWQQARALVHAVYECTEDGALAKDFSLRDQLRRAALSTMTNIAEGFARFHRREFIRFLDIAQSSAVEVQSLLYVVEDQQYLSDVSIRSVRDLAGHTKRVTLGLLRYLYYSDASNPPLRQTQEPGSAYVLASEPTNLDVLDVPDDFIRSNHHA